jgi:hypothetical protein
MFWDLHPQGKTSKRLVGGRILHSLDVVANTKNIVDSRKGKLIVHPVCDKAI